ncbi:unnamed protein product [Dicrocoelium dendriticum]|nr:unnamed protein product [Dicrocoelium dendriticum]
MDFRNVSIVLVPGCDNLATELGWIKTVFLQSKEREQFGATRLHMIWISADTYLSSQVEIRHLIMIETVTRQLNFQPTVLRQLRMIGTVTRHLALQSAGAKIPKSLQMTQQSTMAYSKCSVLQIRDSNSPTSLATATIQKTLKNVMPLKLFFARKVLGLDQS